MRIYISRYNRTPFQKLNRLSNRTIKKGVLLRTDKMGFADYFPHTELGDEDVEAFIKRFHSLKSPRHLKILNILEKESSLSTNTAFRNHQLVMENDQDIILPVVKYKIKHMRDYDFMKFDFHKIRLDANGLFPDAESVNLYLESIPSIVKNKIEYIEDPTPFPDWNNINHACAKDLIQGKHFNYLIYKPDLSSLEHFDGPVIFSSYLGHDLGLWHAYEELISKGDLELVHGLVAKDVYQEDLGLFDHLHEDYFRPNSDRVKRLFEEINLMEWEYLCTL